MIKKGKPASRPDSGQGDIDLPKAVSMSRKDWKEFLSRERAHLDVMSGEDEIASVHHATVQLSVEAGALLNAVQSVNVGGKVDPKDLDASHKRMEDLAGKLEKSMDTRKKRRESEDDYVAYQEGLMRKLYPGLDLEAIPNADFIRLFRDTCRVTRGEELGN